ncbi:PaaI family thioesterase [Ramlibacter tataouinensis]|uniref:PaaI family thioesterase n=1 Tax=Ramlibacter tataouinensis TaxID=94132 RepID=UPI0022F3AF15|nr:PaaI family thioesterase [Ramlibacter tataouinensis]WBY02942.1 PaaI family thioesterase [Ramlibacter tataouinensis]
MTNPDHALTRRFAENPTTPVAVDTNPIAVDLAASLQAWDPENRTLTLTFHTSERHVQGNGAVHGGIVTTMLDFGLVFAVMTDAPRIAVTAALSVQFERTVPPGDITVRSTVHRSGGRLAFASAELRDARADVLARATATLAMLK